MSREININCGSKYNLSLAIKVMCVFVLKDNKIKRLKDKSEMCRFLKRI